MKRILRFKKRTYVLAGVVAVAAITAVGGYAYFTAAGSGSGNATVGDATAIVITSDANVTDLYPAGADETIDVHVENPGSGNQLVNDVSGAFADNGLCLGSWFEVDLIDLNENIGPGDTFDTSTDIRMLDSLTDQNVCQGKTMVINWSSN